MFNLLGICTLSSNCFMQIFDLTAVMSRKRAASQYVKDDYRCGYCLKLIAQMQAPKLLPCDHVFCKTCMEGDYAVNSFVMCPICRFVCHHNILCISSSQLHKPGNEHSQLLQGPL